MQNNYFQLPPHTPTKTNEKKKHFQNKILIKTLPKTVPFFPPCSKKNHPASSNFAQTAHHPVFSSLFLLLFFSFRARVFLAFVLVLFFSPFSIAPPLITSHSETDSSCYILASWTDSLAASFTEGSLELERERERTSGRGWDRRNRNRRGAPNLHHNTTTQKASKEQQK